MKSLIPIRSLETNEFVIQSVRRIKMTNLFWPNLPKARHNAQTNQFKIFKTKKDIPPFNDQLKMETILDWISKVETFFECMVITEHWRLRMVVYRLKKGALVWWDKCAVLLRPSKSEPNLELANHEAYDSSKISISWLPTNTIVQIPTIQSWKSDTIWVLNALYLNDASVQHLRDGDSTKLSFSCWIARRHIWKDQPTYHHNNRHEAHNLA